MLSQGKPLKAMNAKLKASVIRNRVSAILVLIERGVAFAFLVVQAIEVRERGQTKRMPSPEQGHPALPYVKTRRTGRALTKVRARNRLSTIAKRRNR